jgi:hypothetical protein
MTSRFLAAFTILVLLTLTTATSFAFDGQRKGFVVGAGLGPGISSFTQDLTLAGQTGSASDSKFGLATDFRMGYGVNDRIVIFYNNRVNWFGIRNANDEEVTIADGVGCVSAQYFFAPGPVSWFVSGGLGYSAWSTPFEKNARNSFGFGLFGGGGYQFSQAWGAEVSVSYGDPSDEEGLARLETSTVGLRATLNVAAY